ncbi:MAG: VTT domain-containing protein [Deltaproteobacteria bacterium]|nr:VTT domain-containing protein [Deltaproteobacteria bacterium]
MERQADNQNRHVIEAGRNCWRKERAERLGFIVDAADYFEAFRWAASRAVKSLYIAAWDIDSRTVLGKDKGSEEDLGDFLNRLAAENPHLDIYILSWDFSVIYVMEREILPLFNLGWKTHPRIRFRMDGEHPVGASQHQKIVVVDDKLAFCGGIDLTKNRWDTPEHRTNDPRRVNPEGKPYRPFHDVQAAVAGPAAAALGGLFRERWHRATGRSLKPPDKNGASLWPDGAASDLDDVDVGIARTFPAYKGNPEVREVKALYEDAIASARRTIYMENQYLTSHAVARALSASLQSAEGPEIVLVLPGRSDGWLEQSTMDNLRRRILQHLHQVDQGGRLRVYQPVLDRSGTSPVVHAKVTIVDDRLIRVGSSNLSNRSLGLDSECDLVVEAGEDPRVEGAAVEFRNRLLAEHLGRDPREVQEVWQGSGSLIKTVESLRGGERSLEPLHVGEEESEEQAEFISDIPFVDPEHPAAIEELMDRFLADEEEEKPPRYRILIFLSALGGLLVLAALWRFTPMGDWLTRERFIALGAVLKGTFGMPLGVLAVYVGGGLVVLPVTLLHAVTGVVFSFPQSFLYALSGSLLSAMATYGVGRFLGKDAVRRLGGKRLNRISRRLARQGWLTMVVVRNLPVAPFSVVNMIVGASRISFKDYLLGTALGMAPSILAITVFSERLFRFIKEPSWGNLVWVGLVMICLGGAAWWLKWRLTRNS